MRNFILFIIAFMPFHFAMAESASLSVVELGGQMHAAAEACGGLSSAELQLKKKQQKEASLDLGISGSAFDTAFQSSYASAKKEMANLSPAKKADVCKQLKSFSPR